MKKYNVNITIETDNGRDSATVYQFFKSEKAESYDLATQKVVEYFLWQHKKNIEKGEIK